MTAKLLGIPITSMGLDDLLADVEQALSQDASVYYCFPATHSLVESVLTSAHRQSLLSARACFADGMPIVKTLQLLRGIAVRRLSGIDVIGPLMALAVEKGYRVAFYGGTDLLLARMKHRIERDFSSLGAVCYLSPPFSSVDDLFLEETFKELLAFKPDLVFVGLGCPKQDAWMRLAQPKLNAASFGVGYAFELFSETSKRAPAWVQALCLEWVYRIFQSSGRLLGRYVKYNSLFLLYVLMEFLGLKRFSEPQA